MKKYIVCKKCGFENLPGTQFCQRCGSKISLKFTDKIASSLAGTGQKGSSLAPLGAMAIEAQTEELGKTAAPPKLVPVIPLENGDWYCPCLLYTSSPGLKEGRGFRKNDLQL